MKRLFPLFLALFSLLAFASCVDEEEFDDSPSGNFEALWKIIDERYCFFDYKNKEYGLDWDAVHGKYRVRVNDRMTSDQLFEVMADMLAELRDGHVNLSRAADFARYWSWQEDYPANVSDSLLRRYLGTDYKIAAGLQYRVLDDNIGYVRYESFSAAIGEGNLDQMLADVALCDGLVIDVRHNGGGTLTNAARLAARFTNERVLTGYILHKTGKGHGDFSDPEPIYLDPSPRIRWQKEAVVLCNRRSYSATNEFVNAMRSLPRVTTMGDRTGGGAGLPMSSELPNGWSVRYSSSPHLDAEGRHIEFGIEPDVAVALDPDDAARGRDTLIERAREWLKARRGN